MGVWVTLEKPPNSDDDVPKAEVGAPSPTPSLPIYSTYPLLETTGPCAIREELQTTGMGGSKEFLPGLQIHLLYLYTNLLERNKGKGTYTHHTQYTYINTHISQIYTTHR